MKFVCMICDSQMKVVDNERQRDEATMSIVLECPDCFGRIGMLTNPMETRFLDALDVSVCPVGGKNAAAEREAKAAPTAPAVSAMATGAAPASGKCPFPHGMAKTEENRAAVHGPATGTASAPAHATDHDTPPAGAKCPVPHLHDKMAEIQASVGALPAVRWTAEAEARLTNVPTFAREMARLAIEGHARQSGVAEVTPDFMNQARVSLGF